MSSNSLNTHAPYEVSPPRYSVSHHLVTTAFELPGFRVAQKLSKS